MMDPAAAPEDLAAVGGPSSFPAVLVVMVVLVLHAATVVAAAVAVAAPETPPVAAAVPATMVLKADRLEPQADSSMVAPVGLGGKVQPDGTTTVATAEMAVTFSAATVPMVRTVKPGPVAEAAEAVPAAYPLALAGLAAQVRMVVLPALTAAPAVGVPGRHPLLNLVTEDTGRLAVVALSSWGRARAISIILARYR